MVENETIHVNHGGRCEPLGALDTVKSNMMGLRIWFPVFCLYHDCTRDEKDIRIHVPDLNVPDYELP
jgi:hypothetical protein